MALIGLVDRSLDICERAFGVLANIFLIVILVANMANITSRALLDVGIVWVFSWSNVLFVWMTFLGFFVVYRRRRDITMDFLVDRLEPAVRLAVRVFVNLLILGLMAVMLWHAPEILGLQVGSIELIGLERYVLSIPLFVSCFLIAVDFFLDTLRALNWVDAAPGGPIRTG